MPIACGRTVSFRNFSVVISIAGQDGPMRATIQIVRWKLAVEIEKVSSNLLVNFWQCDSH